MRFYLVWKYLRLKSREVVSHGVVLFLVQHVSSSENVVHVLPCQKVALIQSAHQSWLIDFSFHSSPPPCVYRQIEVVYCYTVIVNSDTLPTK